MRFKNMFKPSHLRMLSDCIWYLPGYHRTDRPVLAAVAGSHATLIIDSGNSPAHARLFLSRLETRIKSQLQYVVITHWHWDHVFGISTMNLPTIAHQETIRQVERLSQSDWGDDALDQRVRMGMEISFCSEKIKKEMSHRERKELVLAVPNITLQDNLTIDLGDITCSIHHLGGDHASDSCVVYIPEKKVLFLGDCLFMDIYSGAWSYTCKKLLPLIERILSFNAEIYVLSHTGVKKKKILENYLRELSTIGKWVKKYADNKQKILEAMQANSSKKINRNQIALIDYFINGIKKTKEKHGKNQTIYS